MVIALARSGENGVFNTAGADVISRLDFSRQIAATFGLDASLMDPTTTAALGQAAPRPLRAGLLMDKFRAAFPTVPVLTVGRGNGRRQAPVRAGGRWPELIPRTASRRLTMARAVREYP